MTRRGPGKTSKAIGYGLWLLLMAALLGLAAPALAGEPEPTLPVRVSLDVHWEIDEGPNIRRGSFRLTAQTTLNLDRHGSGLDHQPKLTPFTLKYQGRTFTGNCHFEETLTQKKAQPANCPPLLEKYSGSRSFSFSPPEGMDAINLLLRRFGVDKGQLESKATGVGAKQFLAQLLSQSNLPPDYYEFAGWITDHLVISGQKRKVVSGGCRYEPAETKISAGVGVRFPIPDQGPMEGERTWQAKLDSPPRSFSPKLSGVGLGEEVPFRPRSVGAGGNATYHLTWSFKEVSPDLRIFVKRAGGWEDVTDGEAGDICVGQKVSLKAEVHPGDQTAPSVTWQVPGRPDGVVKDWTAAEAKAEKTLLSDDDCLQQTLTFAWVDGSAQGADRTVTCRTRTGKKLTAETTFKVYKPQVEAETKFADSVVFAMGDGCEMVPGSPSIDWQSRVTLPGPFQGKTFCAFYVQLVKCEAWGLKRSGYPNYEWVTDTHGQLLDSEFPYNGEHCVESTVFCKMIDTPGFPLSALAAAYVRMEFETWLMCRPPEPDSGLGRVAVPLKKVDWKWKGAVQALGEVYPYPTPKCGWGHRIVVNEPPALAKPRVRDSNQYPEWTGAKKKQILKSTRDFTTDREAPPPTKTTRWPVDK